MVTGPSCVKHSDEAVWDAEAVRVLDETSFPKKGTKPVGATRPYADTGLVVADGVGGLWPGVATLATHPSPAVRSPASDRNG